MKKVVILFFVIAGMVLAQDMIVRVYTNSRSDLKRISVKPLDIAAAHAGEWYDIVADQQTLNKIITSGLPYEVKIFSLAYEKEKVRGQYLDYDQIKDSLQQFVLNYPTICKLDSLPIPTYGGRWIYGVKISDNVGLEEDEAGFLIDGVHHAREWATPQVVLFFTDSILRSYGVVPGITEIINNTEIYCFPVINVDGYVYDWTYYQGMWRKNREPAYGGIGNDPNRNYPGCAGDIAGDWGAVDYGKATHYNLDDPCYGTSQVFVGPYANSGDETRALTLFIKAHRINAYMSYHSSGEMLMWSWGWTAQPTPDAVIYSQIGNRMANLVLRLGGGTYDRGPIYTTIYGVSGGSVDWFYSWHHYVAGIPNLAFTTEIGTAFYQPVGNLDHICRQNFKALECLGHFADSVVILCEGVVPAPEIYPLSDVGANFTISWHARNTQYNNPVQWELVELTNPSVIEDDLESGTTRWSTQVFSLSTARAHSATHSFYSGSADDMNAAVTTRHPYLVQPGDSLTFWCWYNLENNWDVAVVEMSANTKEWLCLDSTRFTGSSGSWVRKAYSLEDWVGLSGYLRFRVMTDEETHNEGFYVDDISPVCLFANLDTISSTIPDTFYQFTSHPMGEYYYYVRGYNYAWEWGDYSCLEKVNVLTGIAEPQTPVLDYATPRFSISPNPFRGMTEIKWQIADIQMQEIRNKKQDFCLKIYDVSGRVVKNYNLASGILPLASTVSWDGRDDLGQPVPAGIYFINFTAGDYQKIEKAILLK